MPAPSWFQKLRKRRKKKKQSPCRGQGDGAARTSTSSANNCPSKQCHVPAAPSSSEPAATAACSVSPNRASYYVPSADRARQDGGQRPPRVAVARRDTEALDVRVDVVHRRAGDHRRLGGVDAPPGTPELKLRPIVARHDASDDCASSSATTTSAATTPSTRARGFHVKPSHRRRRRREHDGGARKDKDHHQKAADEAPSPSSQRGGARRRRWLYESLVVVKASADPERELAESMAEMVFANDIRSSEDLEELLACYLALNAAEHHRAVVAAFRRVWLHLARRRVVHLV